jgi:anaerobic selenocysteine-containing dehydrogenase
LLDRTICASAGAEGLTHTLGGKVGMRVEQFAHSKLIVIWGSNPITSSVHFWRHAQAAKRNGATLWCIDPRRSETVDKCDHHLAILPGTDAALAYALMHEWIAHDQLDHDYIARYTQGFDGLAERAVQWPPERAAAWCGIAAQDIRALAQAMGQTARSGLPVAIRLNYGMQRTRGGGNAVRAVACLPALLGAWRHAAGGVLMSSSGQFPVQRAALYRPDLLGSQTPRTINMSTIGDALLHPGDAAFGPRVEAVVVYNSNPLAVAPESAKVAAGFARHDLFTVVLEHFQTDTADYADVVLPATTQLEHWDIHLSYGHTDVLLNRPAIAPQGQALPNSEIFRRLAQALAPLVPERSALVDPALRATDEELTRTAFGDAVDMPQLLAQGFASLRLSDAPFAAGGFPTSTGRCHFYSAELAALGHDGWPEVLPNHEPAAADAAYPLAMISPPARHFLNSSFVNVQALRQMQGEPYLELHPQDAAARQIADGSVVRVFNRRGSYRCVARVSPRARPGVVVGLGLWWRKHGLDGTNVNQLTSQALTDLGRAPTFYDCAVQVERAATS